MKRLMFARGPNGHSCLVPMDITAPMVLNARPSVKSPPVEDPAFLCACGETYPASIETLSYTTEYSKRCLNAFKEITDNS